VKELLASEVARALVYPLLAIALAIALRCAAGETFKDSSTHAWTDVLAVSCLGYLAIIGQITFTWSADTKRIAASPALEAGLQRLVMDRDNRFGELLLRNMMGLLCFVVLGVVVAFIRKGYREKQRHRAQLLAIGAGWAVAVGSMSLHVVLAFQALDLVSGAYVKGG
jgi:hypothetical protein